jgi:hypothetical protein
MPRSLRFTDVVEWEMWNAGLRWRRRKTARKTKSRQRKLRKKTTSGIRVREKERKKKEEIKRTCVKQHIHTTITVDDTDFQNAKLPRPQQNRENASLNSAMSVCPHYVTTFTRPNAFSLNLTLSFSVLNIRAHIPISATIGRQYCALNNGPLALLRVCRV